MRLASSKAMAPLLGSSVTTLTGNVVIAAPRRMTEYMLRPYFVGGAGLMRVYADDYFGVFKVDRIVPAFDAGGGVLMFLTNKVGRLVRGPAVPEFLHGSNDAGADDHGIRTAFFLARGRVARDCGTDVCA